VDGLARSAAAHVVHRQSRARPSTARAARAWPARPALRARPRCRQSRGCTTTARCRGCARWRPRPPIQRVADEVARVGPRIGRSHHAAMQHAGHAHVVHKDQLAGGLGGDVDARRDWCPPRCSRPAAWWACRPGRAAARHGRRPPAAPSSGGGRRAPPGRRRCCSWSTGQAQPNCAAPAPAARPAPGPPPPAAAGHASGCELLAIVGALVGRAGGVAQHDHVHRSHRQVQFLGHDLAVGRADAGAQVDMAVASAVALSRRHPHQRQQHLHPSAGLAGTAGGWPLAGGGAWRRVAQHQQHAGGGAEVGPGERAGPGAAGQARKLMPPSRLPADQPPAAPRPGFPGACRSGTGCDSCAAGLGIGGPGWRCSSATVASIMPLRQ
jgi:hypothetical protein